MKFLRYIIIAALTGLLLFRCDVIGEADREIFLEPVEIKKNVLLLDFTDQSCVNCPRAALEIKNLKSRYGDTLVAVSVHASPYAYSLVTESGNEYEKYFETDKLGHPAAVIDGKFRDTNIAGWGGIVINQLTISRPVSIEFDIEINRDSRELAISSTIMGIEETSNLSFLLWITEDNIVDCQMISSATVDCEYVHNHVLRAVINGLWGENISIDKGEIETLNTTYIINEEWNPENLYIVGFVFDRTTKEVFQVQEHKIIQE